ncbi:hypothetical protein CES85_3416 (plasmid) [Ochrobactrum quorumnocens]|uniref:Uncharacterized protein n=1 Tax=Ochrobactrum quorumnocens TaxID=271865 RepID=A0A248UPK2_9HYPH|nr:hypothetical protein CES85_3416 [[Ochrobactrum] quorumnocens]
MVEPFLMAAEFDVAKADHTHPYARSKHYHLINVLHNTSSSQRVEGIHHRPP